MSCVNATNHKVNSITVTLQSHILQVTISQSHNKNEDSLYIFNANEDITIFSATVFLYAKQYDFATTFIH